MCSVCLRRFILKGSFVTLFILAFTAISAHAAYECPNPKADDKKDTRCQYIEEALGLFDGYDKLEDDTMASPPDRDDFDTIEEIITVARPIVNDCLYGYMNQPKPRLYNCARQETRGTGCMGPSNRLSNLYSIYNQKVAQCKKLAPAKAKKCLRKVEDTYFDKFRAAYAQLAKAANKRRDALKKERKKNCKKNKKCPAPALAALSSELLRGNVLANNCPSFAAHGFVNGAFGTGTQCTMPMETCPVPPPDDDDDDDDASDEPPPTEPSPKEPTPGG